MAVLGPATWASPARSQPASAPGPVASGLPRREEFVVRNATVLTMDSAHGDFAGGDVHVRDGRIVAVGMNLVAPSARVIDGRDRIVLPGFVDTHWHLWNSHLRALIRGDDPKDGYFPLTLRAGPHCTPIDAYVAVRLGAAEALTSGITTVHDWSHNVRSPAHADAEIQALQDIGIRARFGYGWGQDLPLSEAMNIADLTRVQRDSLPNRDLLTLGAVLRTPVPNQRGAVPIEVLRQEIEAIRRLDLPMSMHVRAGTVALLDRERLLGRDLQLVHPQGLTADERAAVVRTRTPFSTSPVIELNYAQAARGHIQFAELAEAGVPLSLSVDSSGASANADFFACIRALMWSHRQRADTKLPLTPRRLLEIATIEGARALGLEATTGSLTPGKRADLIVVRTTDLNMAPVIDPYNSLVYSAAPANVETVAVDGRLLRTQGRFAAIDEAAIVRAATASVAAIQGRMSP
jgi:5-methylthioadenosine/S-adenosylhomocysteine deaminase